MPRAAAGDDGGRAGSCRKLRLADVVRHAQRLRGDRQRGVHRCRVGQETAVDDEQVLVVERTAERSSGEVAGSLPIRTVPHWCEGVRLSKGRDSTIG